LIRFWKINEYIGEEMRKGRVTIPTDENYVEGNKK
jgi:hypothetical protein